MRKLFFPFFSLICFLFFITPLHAQDTLKSYYRNASFELGGNGGIYSVNYENKLFLFERSRINWSAGFSFLPQPASITLTFPVGVNWLVGKKRHKAQFGTGQILVLNFRGGKGGTLRGTFKIGYRYECKKRNHYWLFAYTPFYSYINNFQYEHWAGITWGIYFNQNKTEE